MATWSDFSAIAESLYQSPVAVPITTDLITGIGSFAIKVPGTFSGLGDPINARFFVRATIMADAPGTGDYVDSISIEDTDGVIPAPARSQFASYPTIIDFGTDSGVASGAIAGYYFDKDGNVTIGTIDGRPQLVPSGLYFKATIKCGAAKMYRMNLIWGRAVP